MNQKQWRRIEPIVDKALSIENPEERRMYIKNNCKDDRLRLDVRNLITSIEEAEEVGFLE